MQQVQRLRTENEGFFMGKWKIDMTNHLIVNGHMKKFLPWDYGLKIRTRQKLSLQNNSLRSKVKVLSGNPENFL